MFPGGIKEISGMKWVKLLIYFFLYVAIFHILFQEPPNLKEGEDDVDQYVEE